MSESNCNSSDYFSFVNTGEPLSTIDRGLSFTDEIIASMTDTLGASLESIGDAIIGDIALTIDKPNTLLDNAISQASQTIDKLDTSVFSYLDRFNAEIQNTILTLGAKHEGMSYNSNLASGSDLLQPFPNSLGPTQESCTQKIEVFCGKENDSKAGVEQGTKAQGQEKPVEQLPNDKIVTVDSEREAKADEVDDSETCKVGGTFTENFSALLQYVSTAFEFFGGDGGSTGGSFTTDFAQRIINDIKASFSKDAADKAIAAIDASGASQSDLLGLVPNWRSKYFCNFLSECVKTSGPCSHLMVTGWFFNVKFDKAADNCKIRPVKWFDDALKSVPLIGSGLSSLAFNVGSSITMAIDEMIGVASKLAGCDMGAIAKPIMLKIVSGLITKWSGFEIPKLASMLSKWIDFACPENLPSTAEAINAFLANLITEEQLSCYARANNDIPEHLDPMVMAQGSKPNAGEAIQLWLRGIIDDKSLDLKLRENGFLRNYDWKYLKELAWQTPQVSDLIPFMLRDVFDETVVKDYKLDAEFNKKFTARAQELFRSAGVKEETARLHWRAHWDFPSNTQLYEMFHRLRGGKGDTEFFRYEDENGNKLDEPQRITKEDIKVTPDLIAKTLAVNDVAPIWRERLLAISRPVLTLVDIRRAFQVGAITENDVYEAYRDRGYDEENAKTLTRFAVIQKKQSSASRIGKLRAARIKQLFKESSLTQDEAIELLSQMGLTREESLETIRVAEIERKASGRKVCIKAIRKRYLTADIDEADVVKHLQDLQIDQEQVIAIRDELRCELQYRSKEITAAMICEWYVNGLIDDKSYLKRLIRIGYHAKDAERIVKACEVKKAKKQPAKKEDKE